MAIDEIHRSRAAGVMTMRLRNHLAVVVAALTAAACAQQSTGSTTALQRRDIRALSILPGSARACPGEVISARYEVSFSDGSKATLASRDMATIARAGVAAAPRDDGAWLASAEPLESAVSGFHLRATLASDTTVQADTVVAPRYDCRRTPLVLPISHTSNAPRGYVRIGTFPTPFYDSIVVAVLELEHSAVALTVVGPNEMRSGAITVNANGREGRAGRAGRTGRTGLECSDGEDGEDGSDGESGLPGGQVDFIVQHDAPRLADLIVVLKAGGHGGAGGMGGRGGLGGPTAPKSGAGSERCTTKSGRTGNNGVPGVNAGAGPASATSFVLYPLLWPGSPIWSDSVARRGLEALFAYDAKLHR